MRKLIDANELIEELESYKRDFVGEFDAVAFHDKKIDYAIDALRDAPAVNAISVVRCKECNSHGRCGIEDAFYFSGIDNGYCIKGSTYGAVKEKK